MEATTEKAVTTKAEQPKSLSPWAIARRKFLRNKLAMFSLAFLLFVIIVSLSAPILTHYEIEKVHIDRMSLEPSGDHILGTDKSGRDVYTRLLFGGQTSLLIGASTTFLVILLGTIVGSIAGYFGGVVDNLLMRFTDFVLTFPFMVFVIVLNAILFGKADGVWILIATIGLLSWGGIARIVRSKILAEKENEYVLAAISIGCRPSKIIVKHILPNVLSTIIVQATITFAGMIVAESGLSYLGFGVKSPTPSWGNMLSSANEPDVLKGMPWIWLPPALAITFTILSINFIGEGIKDALNPKSNR